MSEEHRDLLRTKLDEFSQRLDARTREFKERGEFSDVHRSLMTRIQQRRDRMLARLASAEAKGAKWEIIKIELDRDFSSIFDDFMQLNEKLDADGMKRDKE